MLKKNKTESKKINEMKYQPAKLSNLKFLVNDK